MTRKVMTVVLSVVAWMAGASAASAQAPAPPKPWTGAASAGLALTSGNTDTSTVNAAYELVFDPHTRNVVKSDGLLLRGKTASVVSTNRLSLNIHDEYKLGDGVFIFGQNQYLKDEFKSIDYLLAPTAGLGYKLLDTAKTKLSADGGVGAVWEKNIGLAVKSSGAITSGEKFNQTLTSTTTLTQSFAALWKTDDFHDSLYTVGVALAASMSARTQLKVEVLDTYKNKPPSAAVQRNDVAVLMAIVLKM